MPRGRAAGRQGPVGLLLAPSFTLLPPWLLFPLCSVRRGCHGQLPGDTHGRSLQGEERPWLPPHHALTPRPLSCCPTARPARGEQGQGERGLYSHTLRPFYFLPFFLQISFFLFFFPSLLLLSSLLKLPKASQGPLQPPRACLQSISPGLSSLQSISPEHPLHLSPSSVGPAVPKQLAASLEQEKAPLLS